MKGGLKRIDFSDGSGEIVFPSFSNLSYSKKNNIKCENMQ